MEERLYNYWEKGCTTPSNFDELKKQLIKDPAFIQFLNQFVDERISKNFQERNDNP